VKPEFRTQIFVRPGKDSLSPQEVDSRVKRLTTVAVGLFNRGSYEPAFETLMKAYLLDPSSPHVIACEKTLMPAVDLMRQRGTFSKADDQTGSSENLQLARILLQQMERLASVEGNNQKNLDLDANSPSSDPAKILQQQRIEALKRQHEERKKQREVQMWRDASKPPTIFRKKHEIRSRPKPAIQPTESQKISGGLLSRLKQGKFFG